MTTDTATDAVFTINLEEDPEIAYFTWKVEAEDVASNAATVVEPTGLLTLIMKDNEWATYPLTESLPQGEPSPSPHDRSSRLIRPSQSAC